MVFYDVYVLINKKNLIKAIRNTFKRRETNFDLEKFNEVINDLINDDYMKRLWSEYVSKNTYAKGIEFIDTINALKKIIGILETSLVEV